MPVRAKLVRNFLAFETSGREPPLGALGRSLDQLARLRKIIGRAETNRTGAGAPGSRAIRVVCYERAMMLTLKLALVALGLYALIVFGAAWLERRLLYFPDAQRVSPAEAGLHGVDEKVLRAPDGAEVILWWGRARQGQPTILYFHGNGGSLAGRADRIAAYLARGQGIAMMSYRGYSGSSGQPSECANVADAKLAYDTLVSWGVPPGEIILYGESLGSGVAAQVAAARKTAGIVLDAPYTSIVELGASAYPFLPARLLMTDRYETMRVIANVQAPLLVIHGDQDEVIPVDMGRRVFAAAPEPKEIVILRGAGHNDHRDFGSFEAVQGWIDRLWTKRSGSAAK